MQPNEAKQSHHDVEAAKELYSLVDCSLDLCFLAHIRLERGNLYVRVSLGNGLRGLLSGLEIDIDEQHVCPLLCEEQGRLKTNSTATIVYIKQNARMAKRDAYEPAPVIKADCELSVR